MRARQFHYVQQLSHMNLTPKELGKRLNDVASEWAYIIHSEEDGVKPHIHAVYRYSSAKTIEATAKDIGELRTNQIEVIKGATSYQSAVAYLVHSTASSTEKYQYDPNQVVSSYDYPSRLKLLQEKFKKRKVKNKISLDDVLNAILEGKFSNKDDLIDLLVSKSPSFYTRNIHAIDEIWEVHQKRQIKSLQSKFEIDKKPIETWYIFGKSGTGKSSLARNIASNKGKTTIYTCSPGSDPFGNYADKLANSNGQEVNIIWDDAKANYGNSFWTSQTVLQLLDPWGNYGERVVHSRYNDQLTLFSTFVITSVYSSDILWRALRNDYDDNYKQFERRLTHIIEMTPDAIYEIKHGVRKYLGKNNYSEKYRVGHLD